MLNFVAVMSARRWQHFCLRTLCWFQPVHKKPLFIHWEWQPRHRAERPQSWGSHRLQEYRQRMDCGQDSRKGNHALHIPVEFEGGSQYQQCQGSWELPGSPE